MVLDFVSAYQGTKHSVLVQPRHVLADQCTPGMTFVIRGARESELLQVLLSPLQCGAVTSVDDLLSNFGMMPRRMSADRRSCPLQCPWA